MTTSYKHGLKYKDLATCSPRSDDGIMQCIFLHWSLRRSPHRQQSRSPADQMVLSRSLRRIVGVRHHLFSNRTIYARVSILIQPPTSSFLTFTQISMVAHQQGKRRRRGQIIASPRPLGALSRKARSHHESYRRGCPRRDSEYNLPRMLSRHQPATDHHHDHASDDPSHVRCRIHLLIRHLLLRTCRNLHAEVIPDPMRRPSVVHRRQHRRLPHHRPRRPTPLVTLGLRLPDSPALRHRRPRHTNDKPRRRPR
jgi:hypothetical protein